MEAAKKKKAGGGRKAVSKPAFQFPVGRITREVHMVGPGRYFTRSRVPPSGAVESSPHGHGPPPSQDPQIRPQPQDPLSSRPSHGAQAAEVPIASPWTETSGHRPIPHAFRESGDEEPDVDPSIDASSSGSTQSTARCRGASIHRGLEDHVKRHGIIDIDINPSTGVCQDKLWSNTFAGKCATNIWYCMSHRVTKWKHLSAQEKLAIFEYLRQRSVINKVNRAKQTVLHRAGSKSFAAHRASKKDPQTGAEFSPIENYRDTHWSSSDGWIHEQAQQNYEHMCDIRTQASQSSVTMRSEPDYMEDVLEYRSGHRRGIGEWRPPKRHRQASESGGDQTAELRERIRMMEERYAEQTRAYEERQAEQARAYEALKANQEYLLQQFALWSNSSDSCQPPFQLPPP